MQSPKYSVVIPTYNNCEKYLKPCIDSIIKYTEMTDVELVISANGCTDNTRAYLDYLKTNGEELHQEDWVFRPSKNPLDPTHIIKPLNPKSVDYIIKSWCKKAGIDQRISPHSARASYIGSALESGMDLYKISRDVGHASVKTTEEYNKRRQKFSDSPVFGLGFMEVKKG